MERRLYFRLLLRYIVISFTARCIHIAYSLRPRYILPVGAMKGRRQNARPPQYSRKCKIFIGISGQLDFDYFFRAFSFQVRHLIWDYFRPLLPWEWGCIPIIIIGIDAAFCLTRSQRIPRSASSAFLHAPLSRVPISASYRHTSPRHLLQIFMMAARCAHFSQDDMVVRVFDLFRHDVISIRRLRCDCRRKAASRYSPRQCLHSPENKWLLCLSLWAFFRSLCHLIAWLGVVIFRWAHWGCSFTSGGNVQSFFRRFTSATVNFKMFNVSRYYDWCVNKWPLCFPHILQMSL